MRGNELLDLLEQIDTDLIESADEPQPTRNKNLWAKWGVMAACMSIVFLGVFVMFQTSDNNHRVEQWTKSYSATDYFKYSSSNGPSRSDKMSIADRGYVEIRFFSDQQKSLELGNIIPIMKDHPLFHCMANYNEDGSLYSLTFSWHRQDDIENYSDLTITAGNQEVEIITDCIVVELDENGKIQEPAVTVTERDGVLIVAKGSKRQSKTLTFQNETGWYQIEGSWNDNYADMVMLLDWVWEHPIDFNRFSMDEGDNYIHAELADYPEAFKGYVPNITLLGYNRVDNDHELVLKNGDPYSLQRVYESEDQPTIWWYIDTAPDYYDQQDIIGDLESLTLQSVRDAMIDEQHITFTWDDLCISIYIGSEGSPELIWRIIELIQ